MLTAGLVAHAQPAPLTQASITEAVNSVSYQINASSVQQAASVGTVIHPDNLVRTGQKSRAELRFNDNTIARLGADSLFYFDSKAKRATLQQGTVLFSKPKNGSAFEISSPAATCAITGTTGFLGYLPAHDGHPASYIFGLVEGHADLTFNGKTYSVGPGQMLVTLGNTVQVVSFNVDTFVKKNGLVKGFHSTLPNSDDINNSVDHYNDMASRGFVEGTQLVFNFNDQTVSGPLTLNLDPTNPQSPFTGPNTTHGLNGVLGQGGSNGLQGLGSTVTDALNRTVNNGAFENVGGDGLIHGQLSWTLPVDLDLHLILPNELGEVSYRNRSIGQTDFIAVLDHDNVGAAPDKGTNYYENIDVNGAKIPSGNYTFFANYFSPGFSGSTPAVPYTLTVSGDGGRTTKIYTGTLTVPSSDNRTPGADSPPAVVTH